MMRKSAQKDSGLRRFLLPAASLCLGLFVFAGTASLADKNASVLPGVPGESDSASASATTTSLPEFLTKHELDSGRAKKMAPIAGLPPQGDTDPVAVEMVSEDAVRHVGRLISSTPVASSGNAAASRAAGGLALGESCGCDQECDSAALGADSCNIVQCIVRSQCSDPPPETIVPCTTDAECEAAGAGTCNTDPFDCANNDPSPNCESVQRCAIIQLIDWPCDADADFCTSDRCEDDGTGNSICAAQTDSDGGAPLSVCAKQCVGGPANGRRCTTSSDCSQGACQITAGGGCNSAAEACYVGASLAAAVGRCCTDGACTETDEGTCTGGGGDWYRYRDPEEQEGSGNCLCPKYASGIAPEGPDGGSSATFGLVRPSGLMCDRASRRVGSGIILCEDLDGDGLSPNFCQKRCVGGDNVGGGCEIDVPDCAQLGLCTIGGIICVVANNGSDCGLCSLGGTCSASLEPCLLANGGADCPNDPDPETCDPIGCDPPGGLFQCGPGEGDCEFDVSQDCPPTSIGTCTIDNCVSNDIEGGCEDGFLSIGDDYSLENSSFLRLSQFRFRGGVSNLDEDVVIEFWDSTGTKLVDAFLLPPLGRTGTRDWAIELDCWPSCNPGQLEVAEQNPIILPPTGYVVMRSLRTPGTIDGAAAFWEQTDNLDTVGLNDDTKAWVDGDPNGSLGTNVFIFELVGTKIADPLGACCTDAESCTDSHRWDCGICSLTSDPPVLCASTLNDCPNGFLTGNICEFNNWFGPISHDEIEFGGAELTLCNGISPCDKGACCVGEDCQLLTEVDCGTAGGGFQGIATDCTPNCCPVDVPTGSDCACITKLCEETDGTLTDRFCDEDGDCDGTETCVVQCTPTGVTQLRHPYECFDDFGSALEPRVDCDPDGGTECTDIDLLYTCEQSFTGAIVVPRNDTIPTVENLFIASEGELCSLNTALDRVGWFELINLPDPTPALCAGDNATLCETDSDCGVCTGDPEILCGQDMDCDGVGGPCIGPGGPCVAGDPKDDCFVLTVGLCCTQPVLTPIWPFLSSFRNCPCVATADVIGQAPDFDISGDQLDGFGANSKANVAGRCEDANYSATFTVPPGDYAYQINSDTNCAASIIPCDSDDDCPATSCIVPNPDYSVVFAVESCQIAACCVGSACILTNELHCAAQQGTFLGKGDQPITSCQVGACDLGSCCVDGVCEDGEFYNTEAQCVGQDGIYLGGLTCADDPCPACPFDSPQNCQQVQTIFGRVPMMDRNPDNYGANSDPVKVGASMHADDVKFGGDQVDNICWNTAFFSTPCCGGACDPNIDGTWQIRVYESDPDCDAYPGVQIGGRSIISVLNRVAGTGQGANNWHYSGKVQPPIQLDASGLGGDTYWFEITAFGESGCEVRATWSRDHGNEHIAQTIILSENDDRVYKLKDVEAGVDLGFCENSGIATPPTILGSCCTCPGICQDNVSASECELVRGLWTACETCATRTAVCGDAPGNNDCGNAQLVTDVPVTLDGSAFITIAAENICATDDGPPLFDSGVDSLGNPLGENDCTGSIQGDGDLHDDIWYEYVATECGDLRIHACDTTDQAMMIAIYNGTNGCPVLPADELACDDGDCVENFDADITLRVFPGQELLVRVGGWNNEVPGGFDGNPRGSWTTQWSLATTCSPVQPVLRADPPHDILKNRYISIIPKGEFGTNPDAHHIRVTVDASQVNGLMLPDPPVWWAQPWVYGNDGGDPPLPPPTPCISMLRPDKPAVEPDWSECPTLHLTGCSIIPTTAYRIAVESGGLLSTDAVENFSQCFDGLFPVSPAVHCDLANGDADCDTVAGETCQFSLLRTQLKPGVKWTGDVVGFFNGTVWTPPNNVTSIDDAVAGIKTFQDPNAFNATHLSVTDVHPNLNGTEPNLKVNIADVFAIILGFQGQDYPGPDLTQCPGLP